VLEFGVLHADPHPGNYLVSHHPRIGLLDFGSVASSSPRSAPAICGSARAPRARRREIGAACTTLGFAKDDPAPVVAMMHLICEPLETDAPYDPGSFDIMARGMQLTEIAVAHRIFHAPGHPVMLFRALMGLDGYLKNLGAVLNWHRIFADVVSAIPDPERTPTP
jgi:predicted unusual protein kinase regulating ubiquinone biosynthesis (AarF/ABC1/UbiB family)